jgi:hypothetical protein
MRLNIEIDVYDWINNFQICENKFYILLILRLYLSFNFNINIKLYKFLDILFFLNTSSKWCNDVDVNIGLF